MAKSNRDTSPRKLPNERRIKDRDFRESSLLPSDIFRLRLREWREARALTQEQLADRLAATGNPIPQSALSLIESGKRRISLDEAFALAEALNAVPAHLLTPPEDKLIRLSEGVAIGGRDLRAWLVYGFDFTHGRRQPPPTPEIAAEVALERFEQRLAQLARAFVDALRIRGDEGRDAQSTALNAIVDAVRERLRERAGD